MARLGGFLALGAARKRFAVVSTILLLFQPCMGAHAQRSEQPLNKPSVAALEAALKAIGEARRQDHATQLDCTKYFEGFGHPNEPVSEYVAVIQTLGIEPVRLRQNEKNFVYFNVLENVLRKFSSGYLRGDYVVIGFEVDELTDNARITKFTVKLFNNNYS